MNIDTLRGIFPSGYIGTDGKVFAVDSAHNTTPLATTTDYFNWTLTSAGTTLAATNEADRITAEGATVGTGVASEAVILSANGHFMMPATGVFSLSRAALAAAGTAATDAAVITTQVTAVTASNGTKGVALPAAATTTGPYLVINTVLTTGATLNVYPVNGGNDNINGGAEDAAFVMGPGKAAWFIPTSATQWYVEDFSANTATTAELNTLVGITATATELNLNDDQSNTFTTSATPASGTCAIQLSLKKADGATALTNVSAGMGYISTSATGVSSVAATSVETLTNGEILTVVTGRLFHFITSNTGLLGMTLTAGAGTYYVVLILPNGKIKVSDACVVNA